MPRLFSKQNFLALTRFGTSTNISINASGSITLATSSGASPMTDGENASYVLGQADFISSAATTTQNGLWHPRGIAYDSASQRLFVADDINSRVLVFNAAP